MLCTKCSNETNVTDSRTNGTTVKRRRTCQVCGFRFSTFEVAVSNDERVQVKNLVILDRRLVADTLRTSLDTALNEALGHPAMEGSPVNGEGNGRT